MQGKVFNCGIVGLGIFFCGIQKPGVLSESISSSYSSHSLSSDIGSCAKPSLISKASLDVPPLCFQDITVVFMPSCKCLSACHYLYSPLRCELSWGRNWIFYNIGSLTPRTCNKIFVECVGTQSKPTPCLPTLSMHPAHLAWPWFCHSTEIEDYDTLSSMCNHVTDHNLLPIYPFLKYQLNHHLFHWAMPDCSRLKWCPLLWPPALSVWNLCNWLLNAHCLLCDVCGSGLWEHLTCKVQSPHSLLFLLCI